MLSPQPAMPMHGEHAAPTHPELNR
jgi:hypothetical protein